MSCDKVGKTFKVKRVIENIPQQTAVLLLTTLSESTDLSDLIDKLTNLSTAASLASYITQLVLFLDPDSVSLSKEVHTSMTKVMDTYTPMDILDVLKTIVTLKEGQDILSASNLNFEAATKFVELSDEFIDKEMLADTDEEGFTETGLVNYLNKIRELFPDFPLDKDDFVCPDCGKSSILTSKEDELN